VLPVIILALSLLLGAGGVTAAASPDAAKGWRSRESRVERVIRIAKHQVGDPWVWGMRGPRAFDCTGLVYYSFREAYALRAIGGRWRGVGALWSWHAARGRANRHSAKRGDLVVWGRAKHVGIYLGRGRAISALTSGVRIHRVNELTDPFTTYLHVRW
jgi:cell wall-associated NlpC family hydrolase